jgi:hypothetical protein
MTTQESAQTKTKFADVSKKIFPIERRQFQHDPHKGILVTKGKRESELAASIAREYITQSAIANGWGAALDPTQLHVMSAQDVTHHTRLRDENVVLQAGGTDAQREIREAKYDRAMERKERSRKALDVNRINLVEKNKLAGLVLQNIVMPCIYLTGFIHIMGDWEGELAGKFSEQLVQIMAEIDKCGLNIQRLHEAIQLLRKDIPDAYEVDKVVMMLTAVEKLKNLEAKHLLKPDIAHPGQKIPIHNAYQCTPNVSLLHLLEDHLAEAPQLVKLREIISEGVDNDTQFATVAASMRTFIQEHRPAKLQGHKTMPQQQQRIMAHAAGIKPDDGDMEGMFGEEDPDDGDMKGMFGEEDQDDQEVNNHVEMPAYASSLGKRLPAAPLDIANPRPPQPSYPRQVCSFFQKGLCKFGDRCDKLHEKPQHQIEMTASEHQEWLAFRNGNAARAAAAAAAKATGTSGAMSPLGKYGP